MTVIGSWIAKMVEIQLPRIPVGGLAEVAEIQQFLTDPSSTMLFICYNNLVPRQLT